MTDVQQARERVLAAVERWEQPDGPVGSEGPTYTGEAAIRLDAVIDELHVALDALEGCGAGGECVTGAASRASGKGGARLLL